MKKNNFGLASVIVVAIIVVGFTVNSFLFPWQPEYDLPENDRLCITQIIIQSPQKITNDEILKTVMLNEIKDIDHRFDVSDRNVTITNMQNNKTKISFDGIWTEENNGKELVENLERHEFIERVLEQNDIRLVTMCP